MTRPVQAMLAVSGALLLGACNPISSPKPTSTVGAGSQTVAGTLANSVGGKLVAASSITVQTSTGKTLSGVTDGNGKFTLKLDPGVYSIEFKKAGYAASRIEGLRIANGTNDPLNAIQKNVFATTLPVGVPTVTAKYVTGEVGTDFAVNPATVPSFNASAGVSTEVTVTSSDPANSPGNIYVGVGGVPGSGYFGTRVINTPDPKLTTATVKALLVNDPKGSDTLRGVRGATTLYVVAYDTNLNRLERRYPIVITDDQPSTTALPAFATTKALAVTLAQKIGFFSPVRPDGAPTEQSTMWTEVSWTYPKGTTAKPLGYRLWTSDDGTNFRILKTVEGKATVARDGSGSLEAGKTVYYKLEAFNSTESLYSDVMSTTPLDSFTLSDFTPAEARVGVARKPTLGWKVSSLVGDHRNFYVMVNDYPQQSAACFWGQVLCGGDTKDNMFVDDGSTPALKQSGNAYSVAFNANGTALLPALESRHAYTFDVSAAAYSKSGDAVSIAHDYYDIFYTFDTCNFGGPVCEGQVINFTTGDQE
ncbi:hypothetical protein HNQ07_001623 [Deinococcus metalli]|nr:carboxypeptidase-like regulatory domain-containing protein [Deinococcus metalli]MBB5376166.1 hypothetical protein [Deinococcus metalli]